MTDAELIEIEARANEIARRPFPAFQDLDRLVNIAREDIPKLIAEIRRLQRQLFAFSPFRRSNGAIDIDDDKTPVD